MPRDAPARIPAGRPRLPPRRSGGRSTEGRRRIRAAHRGLIAQPRQQAPWNRRLRRGQDDVFGLGRLLVRAPLGAAISRGRGQRRRLIAAVGAGRCLGPRRRLVVRLLAWVRLRNASGARREHQPTRRHGVIGADAAAPAEGRQGPRGARRQHRHAHGTRTQGEPRPAERRDQVGLDLHRREQAPRTLNLLAVMQRRHRRPQVEPIQVDQKCQPVEQRGRHALLMHAFIQSHQAKPCLIGDPQALALSDHCAAVEHGIQTRRRMRRETLRHAEDDHAAVGGCQGAALRDRPVCREGGGQIQASQQSIVGDVERNSPHRIAGRQQIAQHFQPLGACGLHEGVKAHAAEAGGIDREQRRRHGRIFRRAHPSSAS